MESGSTSQPSLAEPIGSTSESIESPLRFDAKDSGESTKLTSAAAMHRRTAPPPPSNDTIVIHCCDEARKINRDFTCKRELLLENMSYFRSYLGPPTTAATTAESYDDIDISVHCDVHIFQWLMKYIHQKD